jgi:hypothetical protein
MDLTYEVRSDQRAAVVGIETRSGRRVRLMISGNDDANDATIMASVGMVTARTRTRIARLLAEQANNRFKAITFSIIDDCVVVDHVADLEFAPEPEALIRKGLLRVVCAIEGSEDLLGALTVRQSRAKPAAKAIREVEKILDELEFT